MILVFFNQLRQSLELFLTSSTSAKFELFNFGKVWNFSTSAKFELFNFGKVLNFAEVLFAEVLFAEVLFAEAI
ncbi:hypothetical protein [Cloacibacterium normanense]